MSVISPSPAPHAPPRVLRRAVAAAGLLVFTAFLAFSPATAQERTIPRTFADLADKALPAVVNITATKKGGEQPRSALPQLPEDSPFGEMLRRFWDQQQQNRAQRQPSRALGSGFVIDPAGFIATNNHVVDGADEIQVTLHDGRQFKAKLVGADRTTDLALLQIDGAKDLPAVRFGDSGKTRVGDWVMAVGNPFNLGGTVTVGVLSARNRDLRSGPYDDYLQIDAPINRGNSGGPLFNMDGEVIGVNTAIYSTTGGNIGIGFAIPSTIASRVLDQLKANGKVQRGWLGVFIQPMTEDLATAMGLDRPRGALIAQVQDGSPAAKAGLKAGEVVLAVNDRPIEQSRDLARFVADLKPGSTAKFTVWRAKKEEVVSVTLQELKSEQAKRDEPRGETPRGDRTREQLFGFALADLNDDTREAFGVPRGVEGVLVARVSPGTPAEEQGLQPGDVIVAIGGETVARAADATRKLDAAKADRRPVVLLVSRQGVTRFVALKASQG
jgi:serine protease Do